MWVVVFLFFDFQVGQIQIWPWMGKESISSTFWDDLDLHLKSNTPVSVFSEISRSVWLKFSMLPQPAGLVKLIIMIMIVFVKRLSMWNMFICAEQVQIQKYKTHAYKTPWKHKFKESCSNVQLSSKDGFVVLFCFLKYVPIKRKIVSMYTHVIPTILFGHLLFLIVLYACVFYFCICASSAQLSMFHMEKRSRNTLIIIIIIIIITIRTSYELCLMKKETKRDH